MSLIELCAGVAIISGTVIFTAPSLVRARENYQLDAVSRQVSARLQWTRIKAIGGNRDCRVRVPSEASYVVECRGPQWRTEATVTLPQGFHITANAAPEFHTRGNVSPSATLTVWNPRMKSKRIIVNITGRVRVE
jgi:Tfp pilus assembly protein FimT